MAAVAATTAAFADVTITGAFDPMIQKTTTSYGAGTTSYGQTGMSYGGMSTSRIQFDVTEDLGGGMKAIARMENDFYAQNQEDRTGSGGAAGQVSMSTPSTNFGAKGGEIFTGLTGDFGTIKLGAPNTPTLDVQAATVMSGTKIGSGFGEGVLGSGHVRNSQTVKYTSNAFGGGFTFNYAHTFGANANSAASTNVTAVGTVDDTSLMYANGPVAAGVSYYKMADAAGSNDNHLTSYFGSYKFGDAKLVVGGHQESNGLQGSQQFGLAAANALPVAGNDNNGQFIGGTYTMGATTWLFNMATRQDKTLANAAAPQNMHMTAFGVNYALSKNTTVYARYSNYTQDNVSGVATAVAKETKTLAGISMGF